MTFKESDGKLVCTFAGHFDTVRSQELEATLRQRLTAPQPVVFEMQDVTYVCSAFLRVCIFVAKTAGPGQFTLSGLTPPIKRVFMMAGLTGLFGCD
jgi:anti-anti-sigma factor